MAPSDRHPTPWRRTGSWRPGSWEKRPLPSSPSGKPYIQPKREIPAEEQITLEPELEEALAHATDAEMCDIAGGQPWEAGEGGKIVKESSSWRGTSGEGPEPGHGCLRKPRVVVFDFS